jgi:hypothetical protein
VSSSRNTLEGAGKRKRKTSGVGHQPLKRDKLKINGERDSPIDHAFAPPIEVQKHIERTTIGQTQRRSRQRLSEEEVALGR